MQSAAYWLSEVLTSAPSNGESREVLDSGGGWGDDVTPDWDVELARLGGRIDLLDGRIVPLEKWKAVSEVFHMEMRTRWDHFDGAQEAEARIQKERHESNAIKLNWIVLLVLIATAIVGFMGVVVAYNQVHHAKTEPLLTNQSVPEVAHVQLSAHW